MFDLLVNGILLLTGWVLFAYGWLFNSNSLLFYGGVLLAVHAFIILLLGHADISLAVFPIMAYVAYHYMLVKPWHVAMFWGLFIFNLVNLPNAVGTIWAALGRFRK